MKGHNRNKLPILYLLFFILLGFIFWIGPKHFLNDILHPKLIMKQAQVSIGKTISRTVTGTNKPINILLIGNNARGASGPLSLGKAAGQADILIVAHIDPDTHKVTLISIPRDTLIAMPEWKEPIPKIKSSFELGLQQSPEDGPKVAMKYVSKLTGLPINHYIVTYFQGFADAIDAVGGIKMNIPERLYDPKHSGADFKPGIQTLNGKQALAFIRIRQNSAGNTYRTDDFQRQNAELQVLNILKNKLLSQGTSLTEIQKLQQTWHRDVATNIPSALLLGLGMEGTGSQLEKITLGSVKDSMDITDTAIQGINKEGYLSGAYYDVVDPAEIAKKLKPYGSSGASTGLPPFPDPGKVTIDVYGSKAVASELQKSGFQTVWLGPNNSDGQIKISYPDGQMMAGFEVAKVLGTANELVSPAGTARAVTVYAP